MVRKTGIIFGLVAILIVLAVGFLNWESNDNPTKSFLTYNISYSKGEKISYIDIEFKGSTVLLNVHTSQMMSCDDVKAILDIKPFSIKSKLYIPQCSSITDNLVQITYILDKSV